MKPSGFTLVEITLAVFLSSLMMISLYAIFVTAYQYQVQGYQKDRIQSSHLLSVKSFARVLQETTVLHNPPPPCPGGNCAGSVDQNHTYIMGCTNYDPNVESRNLLLAIDTHMLDTTSRMLVYRGCVSAAGALTLSFARGTFPSPLACPAAAVDCTRPSTDLGAGAVDMIIGEKLSYDDSPYDTLYFKRPANMNNLVELHYRVGSGTAAVTVNTSIQMMKHQTSSTP